MDPNEMRYRSQHSPRSDATTMNSLTSAQRNRLSQPFQQQQMQPLQPAQDSRSNLPRRFTTDSGRVPTMSSNIGGPRGPDEYQSLHTSQLIEKKKLEFGKILESKRLLEAAMQEHEQTSRLCEAEIQMLQEHSRVAGHQSEPTTPPEYREPKYRETATGFPTAFSRPNANRYSLSSLQSPPGMTGRSARSGSILASPQSSVPQSRFAFDDQLPPWSHRTSRRNSDEDEKEEAVRQDPTSHRATNALNRYSMPVTKSRTAFYDIENLDQANTTSFLFRDDESTPDNKLFTQTPTEDNYSTLLRQTNMSFNSFNLINKGRPQGRAERRSDRNGYQALDRIGTRTPVQPYISRSALLYPPRVTASRSSPQNSSEDHSLSGPELLRKLLTSDAQMAATAENAGLVARPGHLLSTSEVSNGEPVIDVANISNAGNGSVLAAPPKLLPSYSTGDVPTLKQVSGPVSGLTPNHAAQQHLHHHNASMGRFPTGAAMRHSRDLSADGRHNPNAYQQLGSVLQGDSSAFVPNVSQGPVQQGGAFGPSAQTSGVPISGMNGVPNGIIYLPQGHAPPGNTYFNGGAYPANVNGNGNGHGGPHNGYNGNSGPAVMAGPATYLSASGLSNGNLNVAPSASTGSLLQQMHGMVLAPRQPLPNSYSSGSGYTSTDYNSVYNGNYGNGNYSNGNGNGNGTGNGNGNGNGFIQARDSQTRVMQNRRHQDNDALNKFNGQPLSAYRGSIYEMCKDQHGCRYLQKQLENRDPELIKMVWSETHQHVVELMTDSFGNYLCQRLFEFCNDEQRTRLVEIASADMVRVALDQHGTRALQKMIENLSNSEQRQMVIGALTGSVVELIMNLHGNHVIQKCLNMLDSNDAQFIFEAVTNDCVAVGKHRHGCCVLQRCIDHAEGIHKQNLIAAITDNAVELVQDAFGNYVIQYIIDLNDPQFTNSVVVKFVKESYELSLHKYSSNVVEKSLRCAHDGLKDMIVENLIESKMMANLVRHEYGNYVVQTAIEFATPHMKKRFVEVIRPLLPAIKTTPFGRKIQHRISAYDAAVATLPASRLEVNQKTPTDITQGQLSPRHPGPRGNLGYRNGNSDSNASFGNGGSRGNFGYRNGNGDSNASFGNGGSRGNFGYRNGNGDSNNSFGNGGSRGNVAYRNGNNHSNASNANGSNTVNGSNGSDDSNDRRIAQAFVSTTEIAQRGMENQGSRGPSPQRVLQNQAHTEPQRALQNEEFANNASLRAQHQNYVPYPQQTQQSQHYGQAQQVPNRFGAFAPRSGSSGGNGAPVNGTLTQGTGQVLPGQGIPAQGHGSHGPDGYYVRTPAVPQNGDGTFF